MIQAGGGKVVKPTKGSSVDLAIVSSTASADEAAVARLLDAKVSTSVESC